MYTASRRVSDKKQALSLCRGIGMEGELGRLPVTSSRFDSRNAGGNIARPVASPGHIRVLEGTDWT